MTAKFLRFVTAALLATTAGLIHAAIPPAENLLPADTLGFFTVPDCTAFRTAAKISPQMLFWNDPAMKPFHDKFMAKLTETFAAALEKDLGLKITDFADLPQGQLTLAVTANGATGHDDVPPGLVLLLDARDKSGQLKTNLDALVKKWSDDGRAVRTESIHELTFTVVTLSSNDLAGILPKRPPVSEIGQEPKPEKPVNIYFTQFESLLLVANSEKLAESVASRLTGGNNPAIGDDATFAADKLSQFRNDPTYYGWFNGRLFINMLSQLPQDDSDAGSQSMLPKFAPAKVISALGLGSLKSACLVMRESGDGSFLSAHITTSDDNHTGLLKIFALSAKDANPPPFVPADAIKFSRVRLDGKQAWDTLQKTVAALSPNGLASINSVIDMANSAAQQKDPGFDLRNNLFGNLGDDVVSYQKSPTGDSLTALAAPPSLTLVASANPDQVIQSIKVIASMIAPQDTAPPREFMGHKIYSVSQRQQHTANGGTITPTPLLMSSAGGYVAFSADAGILEEYLRSSDGKMKPLSDTPGLADAFQRVGGTGGGLLGYQNQREVMRGTFKLLKNANDSDMLMRLVPPAFHDWMDFSLLPDYDLVSKYFYMSVFGGNTTMTGTTINIFTPRPPQLN